MDPEVPWVNKVDLWEGPTDPWEDQAGQWVDLVVQWEVGAPPIQLNNLNINLPHLNNNNNKIYKNPQHLPTPPTLSHRTRPAQSLPLLT